jgi:acetyl esterase/lipase
MTTSLRLLAASLCLAILTLPISLAASPREAVVLWPQGAPGKKGDLGEEKDTTQPKDNLVAGQPVIRLGNVSKPTLTVYSPLRRKNTGAAVIVCPGGGYHILAMDLEGTEVAEWLNSIGVTAVLLKYRVPARKDRQRYEAPLEDAQRAMGLVRQNAASWGINPERIGIMGFSAGAHLSAVLSCNCAQRGYAPIDAADRVSCRPDFTMLIYPAYLTLPKEGDKIAPELNVTSNMPPTFLVQTQDDSVRTETSVFYYLALKNAKVPAELHLYPSGGHGYGLRSTEQAVTTWPQRAEQWMRGLGLLERKR